MVCMKKEMIKVFVFLFMFILMVSASGFVLAQEDTGANVPVDDGTNAPVDDAVLSEGVPSDEGNDDVAAGDYLPPETSDGEKYDLFCISCGDACVDVNFAAVAFCSQATYEFECWRKIRQNIYLKPRNQVSKETIN